MYQLTNDGSGNVIRMIDNGTVPTGNTEYQKYIDWVAAGNIPLPAAMALDNSEYIALIRRRAAEYDDGTVEGKLNSLLTLKLIGE